MTGPLSGRARRVARSSLASVAARALPATRHRLLLAGVALGVLIGVAGAVVVQAVAAPGAETPMRSPQSTAAGTTAPAATPTPTSAPTPTPTLTPTGVTTGAPVVAPPSEHVKAIPQVTRLVAAVDERRLRSTVATLVSFGTRNTLSSPTNRTRGIGAARNWIFGQLNRIAARTDGRMTVERQSHRRSIGGRSVEVVNVVATLRGSGRGTTSRMYVVSGHLDSRCSETADAQCDAPGANDDASGVAAVLESARVLSTQRFDADIVFLATSGEEQGLYGADFFAEQAREQGLAIEGVLNLDVIGNTRGGSGLTAPDRVRVFSEGVPWDESEQEATRRRVVGGENDGPSRQLARYVNTVAATYTPELAAWMVNRLDRFGRGGDHREFVQRGFPAVRFTEPYENYRQQHQDVRTADGTQYGDLLEFVDFDYLRRVNRLVVASLASLAAAPGVPTDVRIVEDGVDPYDTTVTWDRPGDADVVGYDIVWRDTTSPVWTDFQAVRGRATRGAVADLSKDNVMVGVRAVDAEGNRSPVALAR